MISQWLVGRLPKGVQNAGSKDSISLMLSDHFIYFSFYVLHPLSLGNAAREKPASLAVSYTLKEVGC